MPKTGSILWHDLTVENADSLRDFYAAVVGWSPEALSMGEYNDYVMKSGDEGIAGVCHRKGPNQKIPPQWLMYVTVADLDASLAEVTNRGGRIVDGPRGAGENKRFCIIADPEGAVMALWEDKTEP